MKKFYTTAFMVSGLLLQLQGGSFAAYKASCGKGNMQDCYHLGMAYSKGDGVRKNLKNARLFLKFSCDSGMEEACVTLRRMNDKNIAAKANMEQPDGKLQGDIDHDGKLETVAWRKTATSELGDFYQLVVLDDDGSVLWEGSDKADDTDPLVFYSLDTGESLPQILIDFDQDGNIELLAPMAQSDVSPTYYRKLRWRGDGFEPLLQNALMLERGSSSHLIWKTVLRPEGIWVSKMVPAKGGLAKVEITRMTTEGEVYGGEALIQFNRKGAVIKRTLKPLAKLGGETQSSSEYQENTKPSQNNTYTPSRTTASAPIAQNKNLYRARISGGDHYNSRGARLRNLASVLRQDRANYYKNGGDGEDQRDRYFSSVQNRAAMERIRINPIGISYRALRDQVLYGTPLLEIEVEQRQLNVRVIER